eukprot:10031793-Alexandrium_andersonii.AAC.1
MLGGAHFLKQIGAAVDHGTAEALSKHFGAVRVAQLERSSSGLWMLGIAEDIMGQEQLHVSSDSLSQRA